ncbi:F0F1 ATP synthase subunit A [Sediminitomix flava]|uniref:ATP synthase subunit a n=1 Tax=Sediminitomix flava TaxID=379075 RepID=A0A315ZES3_SEDFL|nr:F0F1 ATP synthase subunit A [Sediminitomix flava]PWJ44096.1 ATP synthase F0 subcomplex A subunit [Sediminitomix flava]
MKNLNISAVRIWILSIALCGWFGLNSAQAAATGEDNGGEELNVGELIIHHVIDDYSWHFADWEDEEGHEHHLSIPLPVILYTDGNLDVFMSSAFDHGHTVKKDDREYKLDHGHITELSGAHPIDLSITKNAASMLLSVIIMLIVFSAVANGYKKRPGQAPKGIQSLVEPIIIFVRDEIAIPNLGKKKYMKYFPYLLCLFFFIWINNLLGLLPGAANTSGNIAFTMTMAVITMLIVNLSGNKHYWGHIFNTPGVPWWLKFPLPLMPAVELIGVLSKPFALMVRLFANITAGHIIILSFICMIFIFQNAAIAAPVGLIVVPLFFLELFVAALQAYIFTLLTALFIGDAVQDHH